MIKTDKMVDLARDMGAIRFNEGELELRALPSWEYDLIDRIINAGWIKSMPAKKQRKTP